MIQTDLLVIQAYCQQIEQVYLSFLKKPESKKDGVVHQVLWKGWQTQAFVSK